MMPLYDVAIHGGSNPAFRERILARLEAAAQRFGLSWGTEFRVEDLGAQFAPPALAAAAVVVIGGADVLPMTVEARYDVARIPTVPVATSAAAVPQEIPEALRHVNCLLLDQHSADEAADAVLGCLGLLPTQRRVFLSYRRNASTPAAVQLFQALSAHGYDVFLDTHSVNVAEDFQEALWHQLCDADVLLMLETEGYFASRWTTAEYGRAGAKGIGVLRVTWPDSTPNSVTGTAARVELLPTELRADGTLDDAAVQRIVHHVARIRVESHAVRHCSLVDNVRRAVALIGGQVLAMGAHRCMTVSLATGEVLVVQPIIGVPTSVTLQAAMDRAQSRPSAIVYDHLGIRQSWQHHMHWLTRHVPGAKWVKSCEAAWDLAAWGVR